MLKMIVAAALVVVITSSSAIAGIMLTHAAFARNSAINAGVLAGREPELPACRQGCRSPSTGEADQSRPDPIPSPA